MNIFRLRGTGLGEGGNLPNHTRRVQQQHITQMFGDNMCGMAASLRRLPCARTQNRSIELRIGSRKTRTRGSGHKRFLVPPQVYGSPYTDLFSNTQPSISNNEEGANIRTSNASFRIRKGGPRGGGGYGVLHSKEGDMPPSNDESPPRDVYDVDHPSHGTDHFVV